IVPDANVGGRTTFRNAARTLRRGLELGLESELGAGFTGWLAWTWIDARFRDYVSATGIDLTDRSIPGVPKSSLYAELVWRHAASGFVASVDGRWNARVAVDDANTERAGFDWRRGGWLVTPFLRIDNLGGERYVGSVIVNAANGRYYEPAPRRVFAAGAKASYAF